MGTLKIDILGSSFTIQAKEDDEYLKKLLSYYKRIADEIEENAGLKDQLQTAILTGIMICDELYKEKSKIARFSKNSLNSDDEAERLTLAMIQKIDKALQK
ncbi:cell division protein ZapA [Treponema parvum]|uniref:Cell division protein ZapA n=1 Tax=Treponema parvum TaxID=138851 RepID=A0A975F522_9SPIR|nr:cell division protein ZapA [Treponema parvum]QTQ11432.1 cell division protein ZapA [Treponema parvum]QTQ14388.1 cell division protein ZapA [Treponema parvum]QTQ16627.1 cell division protein ZapA [Treponema parvum]